MFELHHPRVNCKIVFLVSTLYEKQLSHCFYPKIFVKILFLIWHNLTLTALARQDKTFCLIELLKILLTWMHLSKTPVFLICESFVFLKTELHCAIYSTFYVLEIL